MADGKGYLAVAGVAKGAAWGTAVNVNSANAGIKVLNTGITSAVDFLPDESISGKRFKQKSDTGRQDFAGTFETYNQYANKNIFMLIAMAMGRAGTPAIVGLDAADGDRPYAYVGSIKIRDDLQGYFFTMAVDKNVAVHEWTSMKINQLTISGEAGDRVKLTFDTIAHRWRSTGQTNTALGSVTEPTPRKYVMFQEGQFRATPQANAALDGDNQFYPSAFEIVINNSLDPVLTAKNDPYVDEPIESGGGFSEVTGTFTIPKYDTTAYESAFVAGTLYKADLRFVSSAQIVTPGGGAYYYEQNIYLPQIQIDDANAPVEGAGRIAMPIGWHATEADSAPDGMDGAGANVDSGEARGSVTRPIEIEYKSTVITDPLA